MENNEYLLIRKEQLILLNSAENIGFNEWFDEYSEKHHYLNGWLDKDQYFDEVEYPLDIYMCLIQTFLREKHNVHIEIRLGHDENNIWYNWSMFIIAKNYNYEEILSNQKDGIDTYELALYDSLLETTKFINLINENYE